MEKSRWQKKEKGKLLTVLSLFTALRKTFKMESKLECQQADTKTLISSIWKGADLGTFACEAWPLLHFVKWGYLRDSVFVCTRVRERGNRGPRTYLCRSRTWHPLSAVGASLLQIEGFCPLIIMFSVFSVFACVSKNWISTCSTSQPCAKLWLIPSLFVSAFYIEQTENSFIFPSSTALNNSSTEVRRVFV